MRKLIAFALLLLFISASFSGIARPLGDVSFSHSQVYGSCGCAFGTCNINPSCPANSEYVSGCGGCGYHIIGCNAASGTATCQCTGSFRDCDGISSNGCETDIISDENNCGSCGHVCHDAPCINGQCLPSERWVSCTIDCNFWVDDACAGTQSCEGTINEFIDNDCKYGQAWNQDTYAFCKCDKERADCDNNPSNGCETHLSYKEHCGNCSNNCYSHPCSGAIHLGYRTEVDVDKVCNTDCIIDNFQTNPIQAHCYSKTAQGGFCSSSNDCISSLNCVSDLGGDGFCCLPNQCAHDSDGNGIAECYSIYSEIDANGHHYVCGRSPTTGAMVWRDVYKVLDVGRMVELNHGKTLTTKTYLTYKGITDTCDENADTSCYYEGPYYAYQFCSDARSTFDSMFSLETGFNVPIRVSEQTLYNPYTRTDAVVDVQGCGEGGMNC